MDNCAIYCCCKANACRSYKNDKHIVFKPVQLKCQGELEVTSVEGIYWVIVLTGKLEVRGEKSKVEVGGGEMFLLPSADYRVIGVEDSEIICFISGRPTEYCANMVNELKREKLPDSCDISKLTIKPVVSEFLDLLLTYIKDGIDCDYLVEEKQQEFFMLMNLCYSREELAVFMYCLTLRRETDVQKLIRENCSRAKSVQELAELCGYSVGGLKKVFKSIFKVPAYQWMLQQKADLLKDRLAEENVNLKMLIDEFGFSSPAHFTKFCKQRLGMTPTKYMEKIHVERERLNIDN